MFQIYFSLIKTNIFGRELLLQSIQKNEENEKKRKKKKRKRKQYIEQKQ